MARAGRERTARSHTWEQAGAAVEQAYAIATGSA
jgi:hypothetical protein